MLPEIPLVPSAFARRIKVSPNRLIRVANALEPPLKMEGLRISTGEYPRLLDALKSEKLESGIEFELGGAENKNNGK